MVFSSATFLFLFLPVTLLLYNMKIFNDKDKETVKQLTINAAEYLFAQGAKGLVVACNTATSAANKVLVKILFIYSWF